MHTTFDWLTVALFAGLITLYLQRSAQAVPRDRVWQYLPPAVGCALANYLGNNGAQGLAIVVIVGTLAYIAVVLKPWA